MSDKTGNLTKLMEGYNPHRQLLEQTRKLVKKWEPTGLLEGIEGETQTHGMAVLLENQARHVLAEQSKSGMLEETTTVGRVAYFQHSDVFSGYHKYPCGVS